MPETRRGRVRNTGAAARPGRKRIAPPLIAVVPQARRRLYDLLLATSNLSRSFLSSGLFIDSIFTCSNNMGV